MPFVTDAMFDHIGLIETHQVAVEYKQLETVMTAKTHTPWFSFLKNWPNIRVILTMLQYCKHG